MAFSKLFTSASTVGSLAVVLAALGCGSGSGGGSQGSQSASTTTPPATTPPTSNSTTIPVVSATNPVGPITSSSSTGPTVALATYVDKNGDGKVDAGDQVTITFNKEVRLKGTTVGDFVLPVSGDRFGTATITSGANPTDVVITLGQGAVLTIPGSFSAAVTKAGSPSGVDIAAAQKTISDVKGNLAVVSRPIDIVAGAAPPPPPPPSSLTIVSADFADVNSSGKVDATDTITLTLSADVVLGTGANAPATTDFALPVANDSFGYGGYVDMGPKANQVVIHLGPTANLTLNGTFDKTKVSAGSASGIAAGATLTAAKLQTKVGAKALSPDAVDVAGALAPPSGNHLVYVKIQDNNLNGKLDAGDVITLGFSDDIDMYYGGSPQVSDLILPVSGDLVETTATFDYGNGWNEVDIKINAAGSVLTPAGTFDPTKTAAGMPSGLGLAQTLAAGAIVDLNTGNDVDTGQIVDVDGALVPPKPPVVVSAFWVDRDLDGKASAGDSVIVEFNEAVRVDTAKAKPSDFQLPVSGDSFGSGAKVQGGPNPAEVTIVLGTNPVLTVKGSYDKSKLGSGSATGIDASANATTGAVTNSMNADMAPASVAWDLQEPLGALDNPMSNDSVKDAAATTADWNIGSSTKVVGNKKLDLGAGTTNLTITADTSIDTTLGTIGGSKSTAFKGAGVFEFATIDIGKVNVKVTGSSPLVLKATGTARVLGSFVMDGKKGDDNTVTYGGYQGLGGKGGPGGFTGGDGAKGGVIDATPGATGYGPCGGQGGGTDQYGSGAGGAGFATAGKAGTSGTTGKAGQGGPVASAAQLALVPFAGGSGGGGGGALQRPTPGTPATIPHTSPGAGGGGGGGAFRLSAGGAVTFGGMVSVNGGDGGSGGGSLTGAGGGGGSGGSVLIESASDITLAPSASFSAKGGKGGKGTFGGDGADGVVLLEPNGKLIKIPAPVTGLVRPTPSEGVVSPQLGTGVGSDDLVVAKNAVLDTDQGLLDGVALASFKGAGVFEVKNFTLQSGATLAVVGTSALTIRASGNVDVSGTIDLNGQAGQNAVGLNGGVGGKGRAGGKDGGFGGSLTLSSSQTMATNTPPAAGLGSGAGNPATNGDAAGGAGGSYGTYGMDGLSSGSTGKPGKASAVYGTPDLAALAGGSGGGGGSANMTSGKYEGGGGAGAGGGAIAIVAKGNVSVSGAILANGGDAGTSLRGGDGGAGSGGAIAIRSLGVIGVSGTLSAIGGDGRTVGGAGGNGRIRLEDTIGSFTQGTIAPALTTGTFATSVATSQWIRMKAGTSPATAPRYMAVLSLGTASGGSAYAVEVEGAKDVNGAPDLTTATGFQTDARLLKGEWVRFRVTLKLGTGSGAAVSVDRVYAPFK